MQTKELTVFKFNDNVIRRANSVDGRILYCVTDVCAALNIKRTKDVIARLTKGGGNNPTPSSKEGVNNPILLGSISWIECQTAGGIQLLPYTDEVGLYDIIVKSRKPLAKVLYRKLIETVPAMRQERAAVESTPTYKLDLESIKALAQEIINIFIDVKDMRTEVVSLKNDVFHLKTGQEVKALLPPVPPLTRRNEIILFIDKYMAKHPCEFKDFENIWNHLYDAFRLRTRRDIKREARASRYKSVLAYVEYAGEIDRLWVVAKDLFDK